MKIAEDRYDLSDLIPWPSEQPRVWITENLLNFLSETRFTLMAPSHDFFWTRLTFLYCMEWVVWCQWYCSDCATAISSNLIQKCSRTEIKRTPWMGLKRFKFGPKEVLRDGPKPQSQTIWGNGFKVNPQPNPARNQINFVLPTSELEQSYLVFPKLDSSQSGRHWLPHDFCTEILRVVVNLLKNKNMLRNQAKFIPNLSKKVPVTFNFTKSCNKKQAVTFEMHGYVGNNSLIIMAKFLFYQD